MLPVSRRLVMQQSGFTLLEALIAILVLSVGLLGMAALQLNALQSAHSAYQTSIANLAAKDVRERLWAALWEKDGDGNWVSDISNCPGDPDDSDGRLSSVSSVSDDVWGGKLPEISIIVNRVKSCEYTVTVSWRDDRNGLEENSGGDGMLNNLSYYVRLPAPPSP